MTPKEYVEYSKSLHEQIRELVIRVSTAHKLAKLCPLPANLRPATVKDIVVDNVIWYPPDHGDPQYY